MSDNSDYDFFTQPLIEQFPKAADTLLKAVGVIGVTGFLANLAMRSDSIFVTIILWASSFVLIVSGLILAFIAFLMVERVLTKGKPLGEWKELGIGIFVSITLSVSVLAVVWDFMGEKEAEKAVIEASAKTHG